MPTVLARPKANGVSLLGDDAQSIRKWQDYVAHNPNATIYHDIAWREIFGRALGYRSYYLVAEAGDGAVTGILPLFRVPSLLGRPRLVSVPFRDRGGVVADDTESFRALVDAATSMLGRLGGAGLELKTLVPYPEDALRDTGLRRVDHWLHSRVDLAEIANRTLQKALRDKMRAIRQGIEAGLHFEDMTDRPDAVARWHRVYSASQHSLGVPAFSRRFFEAMIASLAPRGLLRLYVVTNAAGKDVAATIVLNDRHVSIYAYSASDPAERSTRPNDFMLYNLYGALIQAGQLAFDFGADSPDQEGLLRFKRKWQASQQPIPFYYLGKGDPADTDSSSHRFDLARGIVRAMPLAASRALLAPLVRYFG